MIDVDTIQKIELVLPGCEVYRWTCGALPWTPTHRRVAVGAGWRAYLSTSPPQCAAGDLVPCGRSIVHVVDGVAHPSSTRRSRRRRPTPAALSLALSPEGDE